LAVLEALGWLEVGVQSVQNFSKIFNLEASIDNPNPGQKIEDDCPPIKKDDCPLSIALKRASARASIAL